MNARGAGSCDQAVRPRHVRGVGDGDEEQKAEERVGEHDVEMQGGPEEEIVEMVSNDDEQDELEDHEVGRRKVTKLHDPKLPSEMEVNEHCCSGHMPYRSWCHHCVQGRGRERDHQRMGDQEGLVIPEYHMDYCFPGDEFDRLTVLVVIERYTKMKKAVVVPSKGSTGSYAARMVIELINECGDKDQDVILKTDQEAAIKFLIDDVCVNRTRARTIKECAPQGSKGSNGIVERVEQCLGTLKSSLDERMEGENRRVAPGAHLVMRVCGLHDESSDSKTPYERVKGKRSEVMGLEFCEKELWKYHPGKRMAKFDARWSYGLFLGVRSRSGELIVVDGESKEVKYVRTVKRIPEEQWWDPNNLELITVVPWNRGGGDKEVDGDLPEFDVKKGPGRQLEEKQDIMRDEAPQIIHRAHLRKSDFDKQGYTDRCPGCSAIMRGLHVQPHTAVCRNRMETEEREGQNGGKVSEEEKQSERGPRHGEEEEAGGHRGPGDEDGKSEQNCGVVRSVLKNHGFKRLKSVPVAFVHESRDMRCMGTISCGKALTRT